MCTNLQVDRHVLKGIPPPLGICPVLVGNQGGEDVQHFFINLIVHLIFKLY